jgi:hypothetical protein
MLYSLLVSPFLEQSAERTRDISSLAGAGVALSFVLVAGVLQDLARAAVVRYAIGTRAALGTAFRTFAGSFWSVTIGWLHPALWSAAIILLTALTVEQIPLERPARGPLLLVFGVHQLAALLLVFFRAMWLSRALQLVSASRPAKSNLDVEQA